MSYRLLPLRERVMGLLPPPLTSGPGYMYQTIYQSFISQHHKIQEPGDTTAKLLQML